MNKTINHTMMTTAKSESFSILSDIHKDAYGFRPRGMYNYDAMSIDDINEEIDRLVEVCKEQEERELAWEKKCQEEFERSIKLCMDAGAENRQEALRWLVQAWEVDNPDNYGAEEFAWAHNLGYHSDLTKELEEVFDSMYLVE